MQKNEQKINQAIDILKQGGIAVFPTDTAFAVGCRIDDEKAVDRLFAIRRRPKKQATPVLVDTVKMAQDYLQPIPKDVINKLIETYWPGGLTIILPSMVSKVPQLVRGGGDTLGVRIPNHPIARKIIRGVGIPILGPSANFHGEKTPYKVDELDEDFLKRVDVVVKGDCPVGNVSTVIDCTVKPWKILRQGEVVIPSVILNSFQDLDMPKQVRHDSDKNILLIDTSSNRKIKVGLRVNNKNYWLPRSIDHQKAQVVLPMIVVILKKYKISLSDIDEIKVNTGPGSFTGLRVGIAIANTLGFTLNLPVNGKRQIVVPLYKSSPVDRFH